MTGEWVKQVLMRRGWSDVLCDESPNQPAYHISGRFGEADLCAVGDSWEQAYGLLMWLTIDRRGEEERR